MSALFEAITRSRSPVGDGVVGDRSPMRGLGRRQLSGYEVAAQSVATTAPAASMVVVPTMMLSQGSAASGVVILAVTLLATCLVAVCLAQFTRRMVAPGGLYSFSYQGLGSGGALLGGTAILVKYLASASVTTYHGSLAVVALVRVLGLDWNATAVRVVVCVVIGLAMFAILMRGAKIGALAILAIEAVSLAFMVVLMVGSSPSVSVDFEALSPVGSVPFWLTAVFALAGFESATFLGAEAKRPYVTVTRAVLWTPVFAGALFLFAGWAALTGRADGVVEAYILGNTTALGVGATIALQAALACSFLASAMASSNAASRILFSMGVDRVLPTAIAALHTRFRTPIAGLGAAVAVATAASVVFITTGPAVLGHVQSVARVGILLAYATIAVAAVAFLRRIGEITAPVVVVATLGAAASVGAVAAMVFLEPSWRSVTVGATIAGLLVGACAWLRWLARFSPRSFTMIGAFDRAEPADVLPGAGTYGRDASGALVLVADRPPPHP